MDRMTDLYLILEEMVEVKNIINCIIVDGFDEEYGFSDRSIKVMERVNERVSEIVEQMKSI